MSKNIVLCFDGTGDRPGRKSENFVQTNVWKIYDLALRSNEQYKWYDPGVGSIGIIDLLFVGGPFGIGLVENVKQGYVQLLDHYQPGDRIFMFGFSRGATTARVLAWIVTQFGLLQKNDWEIYWQEKYGIEIPPWDQEENISVKRSQKSGTDMFLDFISALFCAFKTLLFGNNIWYAPTPPWEISYNQGSDIQGKSGKELAVELVFNSYKWIRKYTNLSTDEMRRFQNKTHSQKVDVHFLGIWDTVSALYFNVLSSYFDKKRVNRMCVWFHGLGLTSRIKNAFHAVAIDEARKPFSPELWSKEEMDKIHNKGGQVEQVWFAGAHCNVGGGYEDSGLSDIALQWMLDQCTGIEPGLQINTMKTNLHPNPFGVLYHPENGTLGLLLGKTERTRQMRARIHGAGKQYNKLHETVRQRMEFKAHFEEYSNELEKLGINPEKVFNIQKTKCEGLDWDDEDFTAS